MVRVRVCACVCVCVSVVVLRGVLVRANGRRCSRAPAHLPTGPPIITNPHSYVAMDINMRDVGLTMDVAAHERAAQGLSNADPEAVRKEMIARVRRQAEAQEELAAAAKRKSEHLTQARKLMVDEFNLFRLRIVISERVVGGCAWICALGGLVSHRFLRIRARAAEAAVAQRTLHCLPHLTPPPSPASLGRL